jgi:hypothetical protein
MAARATLYLTLYLGLVVLVGSGVGLKPREDCAALVWLQRIHHDSIDALELRCFENSVVRMMRLDDLLVEHYCRRWATTLIRLRAVLGASVESETHSGSTPPQESSSTICGDFLTCSTGACVRTTQRIAGP